MYIRRPGEVNTDDDMEYQMNVVVAINMGMRMMMESSSAAKTLAKVCPIDWIGAADQSYQFPTHN